MKAVRMLLALALLCAGTLVHAQSDALSPRLARIKSTGAVSVGYREAAIPFSYLGPDAVPIGYSIDICRAIVDTVAQDLGLPALRIDFVRVSVQDRVERVASGTVDLECGSTTITLERRERVAFSPPIFLTATRLAVMVGSNVRGIADLRGRKVAVVAGTTNEAAIREHDRVRGLGLNLVVARDYGEALALLAQGGVDALAADEVLMRGALAHGDAPADLRIVGAALSLEPYGVMLPRDESALVDAAQRTVTELARTREIVWLYDRWFVRPLPGGGRLDMPMSDELRRALEIVGLPAG